MAKRVCPGCGYTVGSGTFLCPICKRSLWGEQFRGLPLILRIVFITLGSIAGLLLLGLFILAVTLPSKTQTPAPTAAATQAPATTPGRMAVRPGQWFGFRDRDLFDRTAKIAAQGDKTAWAKVMSKAAASGDLVEFRQGEEVYLEDTAIMDGAVKVRRKGEAIGWWTNMEAVK